MAARHIYGSGVSRTGSAYRRWSHRKNPSSLSPRLALRFDKAIGVSQPVKGREKQGLAHSERPLVRHLALKVMVIDGLSDHIDVSGTQRLDHFDVAFDEIGHVDALLVER